MDPADFQCPPTRVELYSDQAATTPWSDTSIVVTTNASGIWHLALLKTNSFAPTTIYLRVRPPATSSSTSYVMIPFTFEVCGYEVASTSRVAFADDAAELLKYPLDHPLDDSVDADGTAPRTGHAFSNALLRSYFQDTNNSRCGWSSMYITTVVASDNHPVIAWTIVYAWATNSTAAAVWDNTWPTPANGKSG